ncbi:MAG: hypothetical protein JXA30_16835 [Deltaproteobacteria bacterium]|nr:hypothetical protein [Deltaproteobacteria bacterium]
MYIVYPFREVTKGRRRALLLVSCIFLFFLSSLACDVYDNDLLEVAPNESAGGALDPIIQEVGGQSGGQSGGNDRQNMIGQSGLEESDVCGDGRVTAEEKCDTGIYRGRAGACPIECPPIDPCYNVILSGSGCQTQCVLIPRECSDGDGCCPPGCTGVNDSDCSKKCGDGIVQPEQGETCEPLSAFRNKKIPPGTVLCPSECTDDGDPCTKEITLGSAELCNLSCARKPVTDLINDDGCCPDGADANTDTDCLPTCGNGIREANEECDSRPGCNDQCISLFTAEQNRCVERDYLKKLKVSPECTVCMCTNCLEQTVACYDGNSTNFDPGCASIAECAYRAKCVSLACYCGTEYSLVDCYNNANGACKPTIEQAAGTDNALFLLEQSLTQSTAITLALAINDCFAQQCVDICYSTKDTNMD